MDSIYSISANAQSGRLDVVGLFGNVGGIGHWHSQLLAGLNIAASPSKVNGQNGGNVKFTITASRAGYTTAKRKLKVKH